ncbi:MAG: helix-turn-helix domain-containing protein [Actinobacteria bacterium]|nr:helix-turn-helix domain-containing protein [Actinomycetota bacterium]
MGGRFALVQAIESGCSIRSAARRFNVSPVTAHRWWDRWLEAGLEPRRMLACLFDRPSPPHRLAAAARARSSRRRSAPAAARRVGVRARGSARSTLVTRTTAGWRTL